MARANADRARRRPSNRVGVAVACGVLLVAAVVVNQSAAHWRPNIVDDLLFAYHGWCVSQGAVPYVDIWDNKPPGIWWLNAAAMRLCGPGVESELLLGGAAVLVTLLAFVGIARTVFHRSLALPAALVGAVLLTHQAFECGGNRTETYVVACETLAVLGYVRWLRRRRWHWLVLAGLLAGVAPLFKQSGLAVAAACGLHLAWVQWRTTTFRRLAWRPWVVAAAALTVAPFVALGVLASQGALRAAAFAVGTFNQAYFAIGDATWTDIPRALRLYEDQLRLLAPLLLLVGIGLAAGGVWRRLRPTAAARFAPPHRGLGVLVLWLLLAAYLACVGPGRRGHHFMPVLPALGLLTLLPVHLMVARRGLWATLTARPAAVAIIVVWLALVAKVSTSSFREVVAIWNTKPAWYALRRSEPHGYELRGELVRALTRPDEVIYVWGWDPGTYRAACRRAASKYATLEKCGQVGRYADFIVAGAMADVRDAPPKLFIISPLDYQGMMRPPRDVFADWIAGHYEVLKEIGGMIILQRRTSPAFP